MAKDITLNNNCSIIMNNSVFNKVKDNIYNYNKMWNKNYSPNDIKSVALRTTGFTIRFSEYDCITIGYDEIEL